MPTPEHLRAILDALGDGATTATAEAIAHTAGGLPGHVTPPPVDAVFAALGDGGTRDVAERVVALYGPLAPADPPSATVELQEPAGDDSTADAAETDAPPVADDSDPQNAPADDWEEDIDWDDVLPDPAPADAPKPEPSAADIRTWAKTTGVKVPARGGIPQDVRAAYDAAH